MSDKLSRFYIPGNLTKEDAIFYLEGRIASPLTNDGERQILIEIKSRLTPVPKHKIRELVENKAHKFLMDNFVNEIPPIKEMPLDETARWIQYIEKLIYSSLEALDNLREGKEG